MRGKEGKRSFRTFRDVDETFHEMIETDGTTKGKE